MSKLEESEKRRGFEDGLRRRADGHALHVSYWHGRKLGGAARDALENASSGGGFIYPEDEHFLYGVAS